jgi:hypothetical protein
MTWSPKSLHLAKRHPLSPLAQRTSSAHPTSVVAQPVVRVQDEHLEESALVEPESAG